MDESAESSADEQMQNSIRSNLRKVPEDDIISSMPDSIIVHILSLLPTVDAVRTSVLSQKWRYLYTFVSNLDFSYKCLWSELDPQFLIFIDKTLISLRRHEIEKFVLSFWYDKSYESRVDAWIRFATRSNVKELDLNFNTDMGFCSDFYVLPEHIYINSYITKLLLCSCVISPKSSIDWKHVKSLKIGQTELNKDVFRKILLGSPVLESIELYNFYGITHIDVSDSTSLKKLAIQDYNFPGSVHFSVLEITATNLRSLEISESMHMKKCILRNAESLFECSFNFSQMFEYGQEDDNGGYKEQQSTVKELLHSVHDVENLTLGNWFIELISMMEAKAFPCTRSCRKYLKMETCVQKSELRGITSLLESSPELETLIIDTNTRYSKSYPGFDADYELNEENYWTSQEKNLELECLLLHLKTVKIVGFKVGGNIFQFMVPLVQFLLKNGRVLEKIVIDTTSAHLYVPSETPENLHQAMETLLSSPKASQKAVIIFC